MAEYRAKGSHPEIRLVLASALAFFGAVALLSCAVSAGRSIGEKVAVPAIAAAAAAQVNIDSSREHQRMEGFGAYNKALWMGGPLGDTLGPDLRAKAIDAVYNKVRLNTGSIDAALLESPGDYGQRNNDNDDPSTFNWGGFQAQTVDAAKRLLIDLAQPYGFKDYYIEQRINVRWASPWLGELRGTNYGRYLDEAAEQVAAGAIYWRNTHKIVTRYLMLFNEPIKGNGELSGGSTKEVIDIIKRVGKRLRAEGFSNVKFVLPNEETVNESLALARAVLEDPEARQYVGAIGYHPYPYGSAYASVPRILGTSGSGKPDATAVAERNKLRELGQQYGLPTWMTEISHGDVDTRSFDGFRGRAIHIHDELVYADASAYLGMHNMWDTTFHKEHFGSANLFAEEGAVVLVDNPSKTVHITGLGYAIGHYARWIKKGAVRVEATSSDPLLQVTAFRDDGQRRLVLVAINNASAERTVGFNVSGLALSGNLTGEQSTAAAYWQPLMPFGPSAAGFTLTLPPASVTTIVGQTASVAAVSTATNTPMPTQPSAATATSTPIAAQSSTPTATGTASAWPEGCAFPPAPTPATVEGRS